MSSAGTLWTTPGQVTGKIIKAVAAFGGVAIDLPKSYVHFEDNKKPEFTNKFPHGKIPAWEGKDGFFLFEGAAIARYIATLAPNSGLLGNNKEEAALVDQWVHLAEAELDINTSQIRYLISGTLSPYSKPIHNTFLERQTRALKTLEKHISTRTFFVGERITLADISIAAFVQRACSNNIDTAARKTIPNLIRHSETLINQPALAGIFDPTPVVEKAPVYVAPKKEKEDKPKAVPTPAAPKAEKKPKPKVEDDDEDDNGIPEEPKVKNPLDDLPKSTFNLEDWKRAYSNKETRGAGGALEWFYEHFDKEGFSIWRVDFKYPEELTQTFMSNNQIGGFFNRLEASRKYLFGSMGVLGAANASLISGALILRGQEAEPVVNVAPDWESYSFSKLDVSKDAEKAFFEAALAWDLEIDGKKWVDGKNFK
ncbi:elongation factor 1-gamma [Mycena alexandri]|uniref:Elongation factor 1-gamma n=1 Tax=Mycena alexandri TaxID=1745969 RepID=A0AAD6T3Y0_9AGAR|nr:elongation factor 1-gamma [Mycena alexandri]